MDILQGFPIDPVLGFPSDQFLGWTFAMVQGWAHATERGETLDLSEGGQILREGGALSMK